MNSATPSSARVRVCALLLLIAAAYAVPRAVCLRSVTMTSQLGFMDMFYHLANLDLVHKKQTLSGEQLNDAFFKRFPHRLEPLNPLRWPMGVHFVAMPFFEAFGPQSIWTTQLTNLLFTLVLLAGVVGLGTIMGGVRVGLWSALLTILCPPLVAHTWYFSLDYPLAAMLVVGLCILWRTRGFSDPRYCLALIGWSVLGMTVKLTYVLFMAGPWLAALVQGLRDPHTANKRVLGLCLGSAASITLLSFLVQGWSVWLVWQELLYHISGTGGVGQDFPFQLMEPWTLRWLFSMGIFAAKSYPLPLLLLALPGLVLLHRRQGGPARYLLLSYVWIGLLLLTLMANKMERYLHPIYPIFCVLTVWGVARLIPRRWQTPALLGITTAFVVTLALVFWRPTPWMMSGDDLRKEGYMYEIAMPDHRTLATLRQNTFHPRCTLAPLTREMAALGRQDPRRRPLGIATQHRWLDRDGKEVLMFSPPEVYHSAIQEIRDRFVLYFELDKGEHLKEMFQVPNLLVVHGQQGEHRPGHFPGMTQVRQRQVLISCDDQPPHKVMLSLYRKEESRSP